MRKCCRSDKDFAKSLQESVEEMGLSFTQCTECVLSYTLLSFSLLLAFYCLPQREMVKSMRVVQGCRQLCRKAFNCYCDLR